MRTNCHHHHQRSVSSLLSLFVTVVHLLLVAIVGTSSGNGGILPSVVFVVVVSAQPAVVSLPFRMNCGGPTFIDSVTNTTWMADTIYNFQQKGNRRNICRTVVNGTTSNMTTMIANVPSDIPHAVYCSQRVYNPNTFAPPYQYHIPVFTVATATASATTTTNPNPQNYTVRLHFAELVLTSNNSRIMDVYINDVLILNDFDIVATTGGIYRRATMMTVPIVGSTMIPNDGILTITMNATKRQAVLNGIEVFAAVEGGPPNAPVPVPVPVPVPTLPAPVPIMIPPVSTITKLPTRVPTKLPTKIPTLVPTKIPTPVPTLVPTKFPTTIPIPLPTTNPTLVPTKLPTKVPTQSPVAAPVIVPTPTTVLPSPSGGDGIVLYRINCGSQQNVTMTTLDGNITTWSSDQFALSGALLNTCGPNTMTTTTNNSIYCTSRYFSTTKGTPFQYNIPVPYNNASYQLRLHFAEQWFNGMNSRVFDVLVEGSLVIDNLDIFKEAPGKNIPKIITLDTFVVDGTVTIDFTIGKKEPSINGIEVIYTGPSSPVTPTVPVPVPVPVPLPVPTILTSPTKFPSTAPTKATSAAPVKAPSNAPTTTPSNAPASTPVISPPSDIVLNRINCGSNSMVTMNNVTWSPDQYSMSGALFNTCGPNSTANSIYCTSRYFTTIKGTPFQYNIPVPYNNASYQLRLHFAEQWFGGVNNRVFDVLVEGSLSIDNLDIFSVAPGKNVPKVIVVNTFVTDRTITIDFTIGKKEPSINGIEVIYTGQSVSPSAPAPAPIGTAPTKSPSAAPIVSPIQAPVPVQAPIVPSIGNLLYRINSGSTNPAIVPPNNIVWNPDQFALSGLPYDTCNNITDSIYCTGRYFTSQSGSPFRYDIPVPVSNRTYEVRLHFAESVNQAINLRVFDVFIEDVLVADNVDIYSAAPGGNVSYIITIFPFIADSSITIDFGTAVGDPQINGIEVFDNGEPIPPPTVAPIVGSPTIAPVALPPNSAPVQSNTTFQDIVINCGGPLYLEQSGLRNWSADTFFTGGSTYSISNIQVANTVDDPIYQSERVGTFSYEIPVPVGTYEINVLLAELAFTSPNIRRFNLTIESEVFDLVDIFSLAGGTAKAVSLGTTVVVDDGFVSISVAKVNSEPKINGIEILKALPHVAHSVSNGPYFAVDVSNVGFATVNVDGSESHTHGTDLVLTNWTWKEGAQMIGNGEVASFNLSVGTHDIALTVMDDGNFQATEATTVTVHAFGFPDIATLTPSSGSILGGEIVTIRGTGFNYSAADTIVFFGNDQLTGTAIQIVNTTTIIVSSPQIPISVAVIVSVQTPLGRSKNTMYTYVSSTPISFATTKILDIDQPTSSEFGPDGKLYVGSVKGTLSKITLNADYTSVVSVVSAVVQLDRAILGITFDPFDAGLALPFVYISSSLLFHGEGNSTSGTAINGKISRISGANLDIIEDVVTGLPVCDLDHAVNQIAFGNKGELYFNIGSNTNGGVPGRLSGTGKMKENYFSAATNVANLADPLFDGSIEYDAPDDGNPVNSTGVSVYAPGLRNPFGLTLHSNGFLYGTDNGPNTGYGKMKVGCNPTDLLNDQQREDKLVHIIQNKYYGHPNPKRASYHNDPRQCVWRNPTEPTSPNYQAPIGVVLAAATGIIEYRADSFNRQLRGNLIHVKYKKELLRTVLSPDGLSANSLTIPGLPLVGRDGLDVSQAPNGNLIEVRYLKNTLWVSRPIESVTSMIKIASVFPYRGGEAGGTQLRIYGMNFGTAPAVTVGASTCPVDVATIAPTEIRCTLPGGPPGLVDVVVTSTTGTYTFQKGYRYITGTGF